MKDVPRIAIDPRNVIVDATLRIEAQQVLEHFKVKVPPLDPKTGCALVMDYGFAKMFYAKDKSIHFICFLPDWPQLIEGLQAYMKECRVQRINQMNLATVIFTASDYCQEYVATAKQFDLDGVGWDVMSNRFRHYSL